MKKIALFLLFLFAFFFAPVISANTTETKSFKTSDKVVTIGEEEVIDRDYIITGETVEFYGTINGDLYAAGGQITINGTVNGDLLVAGGMVVVNGTVTQNARLFGGQITINGEIGRNLTVGAGNVEVSDSALIAGSLVGGAGNINLAGTVEGNVTAGVGSLTISNKVGGDVETGVGELRLTSRAEIGGTLDYWSEEDATISTEASTAGAITKNTLEKYGLDDKNISNAKEEFSKTQKGFVSAGRFISFFSSLVVGLLLIYLFPKYLSLCINTLKQKPLKSLGVGFAVLVLTPLLILVTLITIIGIPLALLVLCFYFVYIYLSKIAVVYFAGNFLLKKVGKKISTGWAFVLGLVVYTVLISLPTPLGGFVKFFILLFGLGAMVLTCKETYSSAKKKGTV